MFKTIVASLKSFWAELTRPIPLDASIEEFASFADFDEWAGRQW